MPIKQSAKKALRQAKRRTAKTRVLKKKIVLLKRKLNKVIQAKNKKEAEVLLVEFTQALDKAAKNKIVTRNYASRHKSRLQKAINKIL